MNDRSSVTPISVRFAEPWLADNNAFLKVDIPNRTRTVESLRAGLRPIFLEKGLIRKASPAEPMALAAVDAALVDVDFDDLRIILIQAAVHYEGSTTFDAPFRLGPFDPMIARHLRTPARLSREIVLLAQAAQPTIADNSFWSLLMELNQAITASLSVNLDYFTDIVRNMCTPFVAALENELIIAMPKLGSTRSLYDNQKYVEYLQSPLSDREVYSIVLDQDEYLYPQSLSEVGEFGVHAQIISASDRKRIASIYKEELYYTYFKPWRYKKAYRVEGRKERIMTPELMAGVKQATEHREIAETLPQFYADRAVKQLGGLSELYGILNRSRTPFLGYHRT